MIGCLCPVGLSAAGLSYAPDLADIQERTRDWTVSMPTQGFLYPAFTDRHSDPDHVWYYSKRPNDPDKGLITQTLWCKLPSTPEEQKIAFSESLNAVNGKVSLEQAKDLLARADWAFSPSSKVDLIVQKALIDRQYDIMQLNTVLFKYTNEILGV